MFREKGLVAPDPVVLGGGRPSRHRKDQEPSWNRIARRVWATSSASTTRASGTIWGRSSAVASRRRGTRCWTRRRTVWWAPAVMSGRRRSGHAGGKLRTLAADAGGRGSSEGSEASASDLRDGDHRALSAVGERGGGGADRDVPGGGFAAPGGGRHGGAVGDAGEPRHALPSRQEDLCADRGLAKPADRG